MQSISVAIVVWDDVVAGADVEAGTEALQTQLDAHFADEWHVSAHLCVLGPTDRRELAWGLIVGERAKVIERGYRDLTVSGMPLAIVEPVPGQDWTLPASRRLLQMLANPYADLAAYDSGPPDTRVLVPIQVCAPVAGAEDAYPVHVRGGKEWLVANFVFPTWFRRGPQPAPFDHLGHTGGPLELGQHGGHAFVLDLAANAWKVRSRAPGQPEAPPAPLDPSGPFTLDAVRLVPTQDPSRVHLPP